MNKNLRRGLSRIEWVVVIFIGLVMATLILPALLRNRESARRNTCDSRITDVGLTALFVTDLRPGKHFAGYANEQGVDAEGKRTKTGWQFELLPFMSRPAVANPDSPPEDGPPDPLMLLPGSDVFGPRQKIYEAYGPTGPVETRGKTPEFYIPEFICPDDPRSRQDKRQAWTSYVANCGMPDKVNKKFPPDWPANGVFLEQYGNRDPTSFTSPQFVEDHDGSSYTLLLSENLDTGLWTDSDEAKIGFLWAPGDAEGKPTPDCPVLFINQERGHGDGSVRFARPSSAHEGGVMAIFCDGRTKFINQRIDFRIYCSWMTPDGQNAKQPGTNELLEPPYREVRE